MNSFKAIIFNTTLNNLILSSVLLLIFLGCKGQVTAKENTNQSDSSTYNQFENGRKEGLWKEFDEKNNLIAEGYYVNGKANGLMKWYHDGNLVATGNMKDDKRNGLWKICDFQIRSNCIEAMFKNDKKSGIWKFLHDNGQLSKEQNWIDGKKVFEKCWDDNGNEIVCN